MHNGVTGPGSCGIPQPAKVGAFRGDDFPYSPTSPKGPKSHINAGGDLVPANPVGVYNGREVTIADTSSAPIVVEGKSTVRSPASVRLKRERLHGRLSTATKLASS